MPGEYSFTKLVVGDTAAVAGGKQSRSVPSVKPPGMPEYSSVNVVRPRHDAGGVNSVVAGPWFVVVTDMF